jgi:CRISPR system Cascade subunit CasE
MDAIYKLPHGERPSARSQAIAQVGRTWLAKQGNENGFSVSCEDDETVRVLGYQSVQIGRKNDKPVRIGVLDFEGVLRVNDPDLFLGAIARGFGRAKAFGCGLMLIKPV